MGRQTFLLSPCHRAAIWVSTVPEATMTGYTNDVPDTIWCSVEGCYNAWNPDGTPQGKIEFPALDRKPRSAVS